MKNQFQLRAWLFDLVTREGLTPDTASQRIAREDRETYLTATGKKIEEQATRYDAEWKAAIGPLARRYMTQTHLEVGLRGDLMNALAALDATNPQDVRDVVQMLQKLAARETWGAAGVPEDLVDAVDCLAAAGVDVEDYKVRMNLLYPPVAPDAESTDAPLVV